MKNRRAAIFDLDGTLVDNMAFHARSWVEFSRELGQERPFEFFERETAGKKNGEILAMLLGPLDPAEVRRLGEQKEELYRRMYLPHLAAVAGLNPFLDRLQARGVALAIATLAPEANRKMVLEGLALSARFELIIGAEQAPRGKPAPDIYLAAARSLEVPPERCVAFEDAINGVISARDAGMPVVGIETTLDAAELRAAGARWTARDFASLPDEVEALLAERC